MSLLFDEFSTVKIFGMFQKDLLLFDALFFVFYVGLVKFLFVIQIIPLLSKGNAALLL